LFGWLTGIDLAGARAALVGELAPGRLIKRATEEIA
jgi:hypothetical protein